MGNRKESTFVVLFAIVLLSLLSCAVTGLAGGYVVEPLPPGADIGTPAESRILPPSEYTLREQVTVFLLSNAPILLWLLPLLFILKLCLYLGFRKIRRSNVLDNNSRSVIYYYIRESPGADFTEISRETGVSENSLRYHLAVLKMTNKVAMLDTSRNARYYENSDTYPQMEQKVLKYLRNRPTRTLLRLVMENPGLSRAELEAALGMTGAGINWHMYRMSGDGILSIRREGRNARYDLDADALTYLEKHRDLFDQDNSTGIIG